MLANSLVNQCAHAGTPALGGERGWVKSSWRTREIREGSRRKSERGSAGRSGGP